MENYGILLVDDEPAYHAIVPALLGPLGCAVDSVANPDSALRAVAAKRYDLILMDIELGEGADGVSTTARLRAAAEWLRLCPIIAFTTLTPDDGEGYFQERGLDGYLRKPFTAADVAAFAQRWLGCTTPPPAGGDGRLAALLGEEAAAQMVDRLHTSLAEAVAAIDAGAAAASFGHRLGGLAGTLGFPVLSAAWLALQDGDSTGWPTVRALTCEALARR